MTITRSEGSTAGQGDDALTSSGQGHLQGNKDGICAGLEIAQTVPALSDKVVNVASVPQRSPLRCRTFHQQDQVVSTHFHLL